MSLLLWRAACVNGVGQCVVVESSGYEPAGSGTGEDPGVQRKIILYAQLL